MKYMMLVPSALPGIPWATPQFFAVGCRVELVISGIFHNVAVLHEFARFFIEYSVDHFNGETAGGQLFGGQIHLCEGRTLEHSLLCNGVESWVLALSS